MTVLHVVYFLVYLLWTLCWIQNLPCIAQSARGVGTSFWPHELWDRKSNSQYVLKLEGRLEYENNHLRYWFGTREITVLLWTDGENWQGQLAFHYLESKRRSSQYQDKRSWMTLCVISNWLYQWLIYIAKCAMWRCVCYEIFCFFVIYCKMVVLSAFVLEIVT